MNVKATLIPLALTLVFAVSCGKKAADNYNKFQKEVNKLELRSRKVVAAFSLIRTYNAKNKDSHLKKMNKHLTEMKSLLKSLKGIKAPNDEIKEFKNTKIKEYQAAVDLLTLHESYMKDPKKTPLKNVQKQTMDLVKKVQKNNKKYIQLRKKYMKKHNLKEK